MPVAKSGQASGTQTTVQEVGSAVGIAVLGTVLFSALGTQLASRLSTASISDEQAKPILEAVKDSAGAAIGGLAEQPGGAALVDAAASSLAFGTRAAAFTAAGFLLVGFAASFTLRSDPSREVDDDRNEGMRDTVDVTGKAP